MKNLIYILIIAAITASCNTATTPGANDNTEANKAKVQGFYDQVINAHNVDAVDSFCNADFIDHNPDQGHSGKGIDDLKAGFKEFFSAIPDIHAATDFMVASGDTVVAHLTMTGTNSTPMGAMPATNKPFKVDLIDIITIKDGKASERWGIVDYQALMQQLGGMPEPPAAKDTTAKQ